MPKPDLEASVAERLGGRWAISWQMMVISSPLAVAVLVTAATDSESALTWLAIGVVAVLVGGILWTYFMHRTVFRNRAFQPVDLRWSVGSAVIGAGLYVGLAIGLGSWLGVLQSSSIGVQFIPLFIVIVAWALLMNLVLDSQWRYRVHREALIEQSIQQQLARAQEQEVLEQIRESVRQETSAELRASHRDLIARIDDLATSGQTGGDFLAEDLRDAARSTVRPLSHELASRAHRTHRTPRFFTSMRNILRTQPFRPLGVSIVYAVTSTPREIENLGATIGLGLLLAAVAFLFAIMMPLNQAMRRWPDHHTAIFLVGLVLIQVPTVLLAPLRERLAGESVSVGDLLVTVLLGTIIVVAVSAFGSWNQTRVQLLKDFRQEVDEDTIATLVRSEAIAQATMDMAVVLHGSVQSQLNACAATIEQATRSGDLVEVNRALMQARAILENSGSLREGEEPSTLQESINQRINQWSSLVSVSLSIDPDTESIPEVLATHATDVVEEAIANAIHHGSASKISVRISQRDSQLKVIVTDNGTGSPSGSPGLGSRLFGAFGGEWELTKTGSGSQLVVRLPVTAAKVANAE